MPERPRFKLHWFGQHTPPSEWNSESSSSLTNTSLIDLLALVGPINIFPDIFRYDEPLEDDAEIREQQLTHLFTQPNQEAVLSHCIEYLSTTHQAPTSKDMSITFEGSEIAPVNGELKSFSFDTKSHTWRQVPVAEAIAAQTEKSEQSVRFRIDFPDSGQNDQRANQNIESITIEFHSGSVAKNTLSIKPKQSAETTQQKSSQRDTIQDQRLLLALMGEVPQWYQQREALVREGWQDAQELWEAVFSSLPQEESRKLYKANREISQNTQPLVELTLSSLRKKEVRKNRLPQ